MNLFQRGTFKLAGGKTSHFKIECDALTDEDWRALAHVALNQLPTFGAVEGVPRGGLKFAAALQPYAVPGDELLLIVDDVVSTGLSLERQRAGRTAIGLTVFSRTEMQNPSWVRSMFYLGLGFNDV